MFRVRIDALNEYRVLCKIGEGSFSTVYKVKHLPTNELYAMKMLKQRYKTINQVKRIEEINNMLRIPPHQNIIDIHDIIFEPKEQRLTFVMDLMEGNILDYIAGNGPALSMATSVSFLKQILLGLQQIHSCGIIHRDIKPENILINFKTLDLKIADFGSAKSRQNNQLLTEYIATRWYRPPECLLTHGNYTEALDIWAAGCVFYEMLTKNPLFPGRNSFEQIHLINNILGNPSKSDLNKIRAANNILKQIKFTRNQPKGIESLLPKYSPLIWDILKKMLAYCPQDRITAREALDHDVFQFALPKFKQDFTLSNPPKRFFIGDNQNNQNNDCLTKLPKLNANPNVKQTTSSLASRQHKPQLRITSLQQVRANGTMSKFGPMIIAGPSKL